MQNKQEVQGLLAMPMHTEKDTAVLQWQRPLMPFLSAGTITQ